MTDNQLEPDCDWSNDYVHVDDLPDFDEIHKRLDLLAAAAKTPIDEGDMLDLIDEIRQLLVM